MRQPGQTYGVPGVLSRHVGIELLGAGWSGKAGRYGHMREPRVLGCYALVGHLSGESCFESEACRRPRIQRPAVFVIFPGVWHRYGANPPHTWEEIWVTFNGAIPDRFVAKGLLSPANAVIDVPAGQQAEPCFRDMHAYLQDGGSGSEQLAGAALFKLLMLLLAWQKQAPRKGHGARAIEDAIWFLHHHAADPVDPVALAEKAGMSYASFRKKFKRQTGLAPHQFHLHARMQMARHFLATTNLGVKEVAFKIGFSDPYYFSRLFTRIVGQSPTAYRHDMQSWGPQERPDR
ncbi:MAG: helix-turn-helix domain-containing protein [Kiritimatiellae bacterium]|nr:helix-turn-helix domain-containing protein [Kiritimatiellia bacterium]